MTTALYGNPEVGLNSLEEALIAAQSGEGTVTTTRSPVQVREWKPKDNRNIEWHHGLFGTLTITTPNFALGAKSSEGQNTWARVMLFNKAIKTVQLNFKAVCASGCRFV